MCMSYAVSILVLLWVVMSAGFYLFLHFLFGVDFCAFGYFLCLFLFWVSVLCFLLTFYVFYVLSKFLCFLDAFCVCFCVEWVSVLFAFIIFSCWASFCAFWLLSVFVFVLSFFLFAFFVALCFVLWVCSADNPLLASCGPGIYLRTSLFPPTRLIRIETTQEVLLELMRGRT